MNVRDLFQSNNEGIFQHGIHPAEFRLHLITYFKYSFWQSHPLAQEKLLQFISKCDDEEKECKIKNENKQRLDLITKYRREIATQILPNVISDYDYSNVYLDQLTKFLIQRKQLDQCEITFIVINFERILFQANTAKNFTNDKDNAWLISHAFTHFLDKCVYTMPSLSVTTKSTLISIARSLRVKHLPFLEWLKRDIQKEKKQVSLQMFLAALLYLGYHNSFPYEYFYRNKDSLMSYIEAADNLSEKKVTVSIYMLQIFARHRLACCQRIINRLLICIRQNLSASDVSQLARIFYYYSRLKCAIDHEFVTSLIERIYLFLNVLDTQHYLLIIKAVASLDYQNELLLQKLKDYNYELFLTSLKFGCSKLGDYYKAVLDEVENSFANDPVRSYKQEDAPFTEIINTQPLSKKD